MKGPFCKTSANTNEAYRKIMISRIKLYIIMFILGLITIAVSIAAKSIDSVKLSQQALDFYSGLGCGISAISSLIIIITAVSLCNDEKVKKERIEHSDERLLEIRRKSLSVAGICSYISMYLIGLIGGLFYPILLIVLSVFTAIYTLAYFITHIIYTKIM